MFAIVRTGGKLQNQANPLQLKMEREKKERDEQEKAREKMRDIQLEIEVLEKQRVKEEIEASKKGGRDQYRADVLSQLHVALNRKKVAREAMMAEEAQRKAAYAVVLAQEKEKADDAALRGLVDGQTVRVFNDRGSYRCRAAVSDADPARSRRPARGCAPRDERQFDRRLHEDRRARHALALVPLGKGGERGLVLGGRIERAPANDDQRVEHRKRRDGDADDDHRLPRWPEGAGHQRGGGSFAQRKARHAEPAHIGPVGDHVERGDQHHAAEQGARHVTR